jgi:hypothetical protein
LSRMGLYLKMDRLKFRVKPLSPQNKKRRKDSPSSDEFLFAEETTDYTN